MMKHVKSFFKYFMLWIYRRQLRNAEKTIVLLFHSVSTQANDYSAVSPTVFQIVISELRDAGYAFISTATLYDQIIAKNVPCGKQVVVTFDDAEIGLLEFAYPVLVQNNIPFSVYVAESLLGETTAFSYAKVPPSHIASNEIAKYRGFRISYCTLENLRSMDTALATFGGHSTHHTHLARLTKEGLLLELDSNLKFMRSSLGHGAEPMSFAYPFGEFNATVTEAVGERYALAYTVVSGSVSSDTDPLEVPRVNLHGDLFNCIRSIRDVVIPVVKG